MDFIDTALELEIKTIERYKMLVDQCAGHEGIRHILNMLISDHETHLASLRSWQDEADFARDEPGVFPEVRQLLEDMKSAKDIFSCDINQLKLYQEARDLVLEKQDVYQKIQSRFPDQAGRDWMERLIREERKQALVLNNIIRMVERPEQWLEDAEFSHLDEY